MMEGIPESWVKTSVGDITSYVQRGKSPKYTDYSDLPVINQKCIRWHGVDKEHVKYIHPKQWSAWGEERFLKDGDILWNSTGTGTIGRACIYKRSYFSKAVVDSHVTIVRCEPENINPEYVFYFIASPFVQKKIEEMQSGSTNQVELGKGAINETSIPLAPFNEQKRIVAKIEELFSELDKGIENLKTAREQLKIYRQAVLKYAFEGKLTADWRKENKNKLETADELLDRIKQEREAAYQQQLEEWQAAVKIWEQNGKEGKKPTKPSKHKALEPIEVKELAVLPDIPVDWIYIRLAEIARVGSGMSVSKGRKLENPMDVPYLRVANVQRGKLILDEIKTMLIEKGKLKDLALQKWDVLFNEGGDRDKLGRGWVWEGQVNPCITQNHVFRATTYLGGEFHSKFISHWGNTFGQNYFEKGGKQTTNLASINKTVLSMFPVPLPSLQEQTIIIEKLDDVMSMIDSIEQEIESGIVKTEILRQSILKQAFSGKLVAQDPKDEPASVLLERIKAEKQNSKAKKRKAA